MPRPTIGAYFDQPLDVQSNLAAKVTLDLVSSVDDLAKPVDLLFRQVPNACVRIDVRLDEDLLAGWEADPVDVGEGDLSPLLAGDVYTCDACHALPLPLLVLGIGADDHHRPVPADYFAVVAAG